MSALRHSPRRVPTLPIDSSSTDSTTTSATTTSSSTASKQTQQASLAATRASVKRTAAQALPAITRKAGRSTYRQASPGNGRNRQSSEKNDDDNHEDEEPEDDDNDDDDDDDDASEPSDDSADASTHSSAKKKPSSKMKLVSAAARLAKGGAASAAAAASSGKHTWPAFTTSFTHSSPSPLTTKLSYVDTASAINTPHYTHAAVLPTIPPQEQRFAQSVVDIVRAHYTRGANAAEAAHMRKYMRSLFHYFGLKSPQRTALSSAILTELAEKAIHPASFDASAATIRLLFAQPERECHYFAMNFLQHFVVQPHVKLLRSKKTSASANKDTKDPTPAVATTGLDILNFTKEIAQLHAWWDTIDGLSTTVVGEVVMANRDELEPVMRAWIADDCLWVRRMALLHQLQYKEKTNEDLLFTFVLARHDETDFFIQKAMGWALRQHARVRPSVVRAFVRNFRHVLPRLTQKEAMKHL